MDIKGYVVFYDDSTEEEEDAQITVRWHGGQTFNVYVGESEVDVFTAGDEVPTGYGEVQPTQWTYDHAASWFAGRDDELDTESSESRQHFIETGEYLRRGEES